MVVLNFRAQESIGIFHVNKFFHAALTFPRPYFFQNTSKQRYGKPPQNPNDRNSVVLLTSKNPRCQINTVPAYREKKTTKTTLFCHTTKLQTKKTTLFRSSGFSSAMSKRCFVRPGKSGDFRIHAGIKLGLRPSNAELTQNAPKSRPSG